MTTNRLASRQDGGTSKISAREWAQMARDKGLLTHAAAWEQAYRDGWDDLHYRPDPMPDHPAIGSTKMLAAGDDD